jgi:hypothetical protein
MATKLGFQMYGIMPCHDLRQLNKPVRYRPWMMKHELVPAIPLRDLCAIQEYLVDIVGMEPVPFKLLVKRGVFHNGEWREIAKDSCLYAWIR